MKLPEQIIIKPELIVSITDAPGLPLDKHESYDCLSQSNNSFCELDCHRGQFKLALDITGIEGKATAAARAAKKLRCFSLIGVIDKSNASVGIDEDLLPMRVKIRRAWMRSFDLGQAKFVNYRLATVMPPRFSDFAFTNSMISYGDFALDLEYWYDSPQGEIRIRQPTDNTPSASTGSLIGTSAVAIGSEAVAIGCNATVNSHITIGIINS